MRVVAGVAKGRRLIAPPGTATRPTSDRVREAIFGMLGSRIDLDGATVLDLFAGSGAMGIEALSRGAARATFVDNATSAVRTIRANLDVTGLAGTVVETDVLRFLRDGATSAAVAFADPPYAWDGWIELFAWVRAGVVVAESDRPIDPGPRWRVLKVSRYGDTVVTLASGVGAGDC